MGESPPDPHFIPTTVETILAKHCCMLAFDCGDTFFFFITTGIKEE